MLYFAYASNLDPVQMRERCPNHTPIGLAALRDHRLAFPLYSERWGGGAASVVPSHGHTVWGYLYELGEEDVAAQDFHEGWHGAGDPRNRYDRETVTVDLVRPDDGSVPRRVRAMAYVGRPTEPAAPQRRYLDAILAGARHHRLPEDYIAALAGIPVAAEPPAQSGGSGSS
jgi:hypothetical protein